ncbi:MAG: hypothetical protein ACYDCC_01880 [Actinomycetota bacterium]
MDSYDRVEKLAFAGRLRDAAKALGDPADYLGKWWLAYLHNCFGRFDDAVLIGLEIAEESGDALLASRALVTCASALRQLERHAAALPLDEGALRLAPDDVSRAHALIGLAADSVGLRRENECLKHIDEAAVIIPHGEWRARVRLAWVRCEHALMTTRARRAASHAHDAIDRSIQASARRHHAKSLLFLGFCLKEAADDSWKAPMKQAREVASRMGARPIVQVADTALKAIKSA